MHVTAVDLTDLAGQLTEIEMTWTGAPARRDLPVAFNQANHVRAQTHNGSAWLAGTVTLPDARPNRARLAAAVHRLVVEHDALRARLRPSPEPRQDVFDAAQVGVRPRLVGNVWHGFTVSLLTQRCRAGDVPGLFFGLLDDKVICAFDHAHADAVTIDLVLRRILEYYVDPTAPDHPARSFTARCVLEADGGSALAGVGDQTQLLRIWQDFFAVTDDALPAFPLPLGHGRAPQCTKVIELLDAVQADDALGTGSFATLLNALAGAVAEVGGPPRLPLLIPVHTRGARDSGWHGTAGWMVSNAPVVVDAHDPAGAQRWLTHAAALTTLPLDQVLEQCRPHFVTDDVFMVSYLDYRKLGTALPGAQHISAVTSTDTAQFWFTRSKSGLELRVRYPGREPAHSTIGKLLVALTARVRDGLNGSPTRSAEPVMARVG